MPITPEIDSVLTWILHLEDGSMTGKTVDLNDGAGWTRFGITSQDASSFCGDFREYSTTAAAEAAKIFYYTHYWHPLNLDQYPLEYAASVLSCVVNCGVTGTRMILGAAKDATLNAFIDAWKLHYQAIVEVHAYSARFLNGWLHRAETVYPNYL